MITCGYCGSPMRQGECTGCDGFGGSYRALQLDKLAHALKGDIVTFGSPDPTPEELQKRRDDDIKKREQERLDRSERWTLGNW